MTSRERNLLLNMNVGHFLTHFNMLVFPALLLPLSQYYHLDLKEVLPFSFWMYLLFGISGLPWGMLTDKVGARLMLFLFFVGCGVSEIMASFFIASPLLFSLCLGGVGLFAGIYHPAGLGAISKGIKRMSFALGINGMCGNLGLATSPLIAGIMNYFFGLRATFLLVGLCNLVGAMLVFFFPFSLHTYASQGGGANTTRLLKPFAMLCLCMMLVGIVYRGNTVILPTYFQIKNKEIFIHLQHFWGHPLSPNVVATLTTSLVFGVGMIGQFIGGIFAERYDPKIGYFFFHLATVFLAIGMSVFSNIPLIIITMLYFLFLLGMQPMENTLVARFTPTRLRHSGFGIKFILNFGVGSFSVFLVGIIKHYFSLSAVFLAFAGISFLLVLCIGGLFWVTRDV